MNMKKALQLASALLVLSMSTLIAQPTNDLCSSAIDVMVAADEASAVQLAADTRGATNTSGPAVCSGGWFADDVWFRVEVPDGMAADAVHFQTYFGTEADDVRSLGMAIYESCDNMEVPLQCFSIDDPDFNSIFRACLDSDSTYFVRVWSGGAPTDFSGTFRVAAWAVHHDETDIVLFEEDFADGLGEWTTFGNCADADSNANAVWRYLPQGRVDGGTFVSLGVRINSNTACNGAVGVDSDYDDNLGNDLNPDQTPITPGPCTQPAQYVLVSPAIYSGDWDVAGLTLKWTQVIRNFQSTFMISYRTTPTGGAWSDWTNISINQEHETNGASFTRDQQRFFLPTATEGDSIQIRYVYNSNYYYWAIDDVKLVETEAHNMRSQSNFFAISPAVITPFDQDQPWIPLNDIYNAGALPQTNVNLNFTAYNDAMVEIYNENVPYGTIAPDSLAENVNFPAPVTVPMDAPQMYTGTYTVTSDSATAENDFNFGDNSNTFNWWTSDNIFAMETGATREVAVNTLQYADGAPFSYTFGNHYYFPNGSAREAISITWGVFDPTDIAGVPINVILWEWADENGDQICQFAERDPLAFSQVTLDGSEGDNAIIETDLENFNNPGQPIVLNDNTAYLAMIEYNADDQTIFFMLSSEQYDYSAVALSSEQAGDPIYGPVLGFSTDGNIQGIDYEVTEFGADERIFFGFDLVGLVRLNLFPIIGVNDPLPEDNLIEVFPNPTAHDLTVKLDFADYQDKVRLKVMDINGKVLDTRYVDGVQNKTVDFNVSNYASGAYLLRVESEAGSRTKRFVVQR